MITLPKYHFVVALAFMGFLLTPTAHAYFMTVNDLIPLMQEYEKAEAKHEGTDYGAAQTFRAYVQGVYDATESDYSTPKNFNSRQLCAVVAKYFKENPKEWNQPAADVVRKALRQAFPKR
jgi:hypothetical protein